MPPELRKAHHDNDFAVMAAYGFDKKITESECVAEFMKHINLLLAQRILKGYAELVELVRELGRVDFALAVDL